LINDVHNDSNWYDASRVVAAGFGGQFMTR